MQCAQGPPQVFRAARRAERICPRKIFKSIRKTVWKTRKRIRKTIRNAIEKFFAPLRPTKNFSPPIFHQILKVFHRRKFAQKKFFFTARLCRGSHANNSRKNAPRMKGKWKSFGWVRGNSGNRSESCSENCGFRIDQVVRGHSENGISYSENGISNSESCSENTPELSQSSENGLSAPRAFFLKSGWFPGFWVTQYPDLQFLDVWVKTKENHPKHHGFFTPLDPSTPVKTPRKTEKNSWKCSKHQGLSLVRKYQGKLKHQGMEYQGNSMMFNDCAPIAQ